MPKPEPSPAAEKEESRIVGVALAGGASRRMGRDKTRIQLGGRSLVERAVDLLATVVSDVVVADRGRHLVEGTISLTDGPGAGPAAGLLGAATARPGHRLLVLACDLPRVPTGVLRLLVETGTDADWVVPAWDEEGRHLEPLCACYSPRALAVLAAQVEQGVYAVRRLVDDPELVVEPIGHRRLEAFGRPEEIFWNVNTPDDLASLRGNAGGG